MEKHYLEKDIKVICVKAKSFPEGIAEAHQKLHSLIPFSAKRRYFGISRPENGIIIYKAAVEELQEGEAEKLNCESFIIPKGDYISETLTDWHSDMAQVEKTFKKLLSDSRLDKNGFCLEMYLNETDMKCLVKLDSSEK